MILHANAALSRRQRERLVELVFGGATTRIPSPWGLARDARGRVLVSGDSGIYELGGAKVAAVASGPIAAAPNGDLFVADRTRVGRIDPGGRVETLSSAVAAPHALVVRRDGSLLVSDSGNGRLLRIDPVTRVTAVVASGLRNPLGAIEDVDGDVLVVEFDTGRLLRPADGWVVAAALRKPYALTQSPDGSLYVVERGDLTRPSGAIATVSASARSSG